MSVETPVVPAESVFESSLPLADKLERARTELLDLSARNRLLNMPKGSRGSRSIEIVDEMSSEIFRLLVREAKAFTFLAGMEASSGQLPLAGEATSNEVDEEEVVLLEQPADDVGADGLATRHTDTKLQTRLTEKGLQKRLLELYLDARTLEEEQGVNVLYLTLGTLQWVDPHNAANVRRAPLILVPVQLDRSHAAERFNLKVRQEEFASNLSLEAFLDRVHGLRMPPFEASDDFSTVDYFQQVADCVRSKKDWRVEFDQMSLGFFSFSKFLMYRDLDPEVWPDEAALAKHPIVRSLLTEGFQGEGCTTSENANVDAIIAPSEMVHILDCDSSQTLAIHEVRQGRNLIVQGPPGTGKSQTIANIIASAIKDNKKVLFVAEKMAALEVVKRRLDQTGVGDACLELHSNKANKRAVLEELRRTWELGAPKKVALSSLFAQLTSARDVLNSHAARLHRIDDQFGLTPFKVMGELTRLRGANEKPNDLQLKDCETWGPEGFASRRALLEEMASRLVDMGVPSDHPWVGVELTSINPIAVDRIHAQATNLLQHLTEALEKFLESAHLIQAISPQTFADVPALVAHLARIGSAPLLSEEAFVDGQWNDPDSIRRILDCGDHYGQAVRQLGENAKQASIQANIDEEISALKELPERFDSRSAQRLSALVEPLARLTQDAASLAQALGRPAGHSLTDIQTLLRIAERVASAPPASPETFASNLWDSGVERAGDLAEAVDTLQKARRSIGTRLSVHAWDVDLGQARVTLAAKGRSWTRFLSGKWRSSNSLVRSMLGNRNAPLEEVIELLDHLSVGQASRKLIADDDSFGRSAFGGDWRGERSQPGPLLAIVEWMRSLKGLGAEPRLIASRGPEKATISVRADALRALRQQIEPAIRLAVADLHGTKSPSMPADAPPGLLDLNSLLLLCVRYSNAWRKCQELHAAPIATLCEAISFVELLKICKDARTLLLQMEQVGQSAFGEQWLAENSDWQSLRATANWIFANGDIRELAGSVRERESLISRSRLLDSLRRDVETELTDLSTTLQLRVEKAFGSAIENAQLESIRRRLDAWTRSPESLSIWVSYCACATSAKRQGCGSFVDRLDDGRLLPEAVLSAYEMAYYEAAYARMVAQDAGLATFDGASHQRRVSEFARLDRDRIFAASSEVMNEHHGRLPSLVSGGLGTVGLLRGEIQKKRAHMPIRKLFERAGPVVQALKPVFMMSPLSVAQFLTPGKIKFDLLVMDEASQIQPVDALGAIARANQVVVVGDPKQLPPTSFFTKMTSVDDDDDDEAAPIAAIESILGLFAARGLPSRMLRWHYRSRHQSLIAVSNRQFYENKLFVVPSPYRQSDEYGLRFHHVADGLFDTGGKRVNTIEAQAVARAIVDHAVSRPSLSLGVVAFSAAQRRAIIDELEILRRDLPPEQEEFFRAHPAEPFFVKNLENVQGDERDVIFISVGYSRSTVGGRVPMRFGPLGTEGGERRLNVLISRSKQQCHVFSSITDEDIDPSYAAGKKGVFSLRVFLQYARTGNLPMAEVSGREHDSVFEEQVADALSSMGYDVQAQIGIAGFFVDLAVTDPKRPGRFVLGIECDGAPYHDSRSARDRDRLRQMILEEHGWNIHRIWSTDWFQRPKEQLDLLVRRIEAARAEQSSQDSLHVGDTATSPLRIEREAPEEGEQQQIFCQYEESWLSKPKGVGELHEAPLPLLTELVVEVVKIEGPIHSELVVARLRDAWGLRRAGTRIEEAVGNAIRSAVRLKRIRRFQDFLAAPETAPVPRDRSNVETAALRKAEMLPPIEIEAAALFLIQKNYGASKEQLIQTISRGLGIKATSSQVWEVISRVLDSMRRAGKIHDNGGMLSVS